MKDYDIYKKSLVLNKNSNGFIYKYIQDSNMRTMYKKVNNKFLQLLSRVIMKYYLPGKSLFLGNWKKELSRVNQVIIFDNGFKSVLVKYIKRKRPDCRIIVFCWNLLGDDNLVLKNKRYIDQIYSFDINEVAKYQLKFNNSFYTKDLKLPSVKNEYDLFFLGLDKGRKQQIDEIKTTCDKYNITTCFKIIRSEKDYVDYDTYLELLNKSKCVLDITKKGQAGLTVRSMECLFFQKKLITDNKNIKRFNFYRKSNIFILGEDNVDDLADFINSSFEKIEQSIIDEYDYKKWCLRMLKNEEQKYKK